MSFDGIKVTHSSLTQGATAMQTTFTKITSRLDQLEGDLSDLRGGWSGEQRHAYDSAKQKWDSAMDEMKELLKETRLAVESSQADYQKADSDGAKRFM